MNRHERRADEARRRRNGSAQGPEHLQRVLDVATAFLQRAGAPPLACDDLVLLAIVGTGPIVSSLKQLTLAAVDLNDAQLGPVRLALFPAASLRALGRDARVSKDDDFRRLLDEHGASGSLLVVAAGDDGSFKSIRGSWVGRADKRSSLEAWARIHPGVTSAGGTA